MSVAAIVCRGFGPGATGINRIVGRGYAGGFPYPPGTPQAGYQYIQAAASPWDPDSIFDALSTVGNVAEVSEAVTPNGAALNMGGDGLPYLAQVVTGRQSFQYREYDGSQWIPITGGGTYSTYYINDQGPLQAQPFIQYQWNVGASISAVVLDDFIQDPEGDTLVYTGTASIPAGLTLATVTQNPGQPNQRVVQQIQGTPVSAGTGAIVLTATDAAGKTLTPITIPYITLSTLSMPNEVGQNYDVAFAAITALGIITVGITQSLTGVLGVVSGQQPAPGSPINQNTAVTLTVNGFLVPNVVGQSFAAARAALSALGLVVQAAASVPGFIVTAQSIPANTFIYTLPASITLTLAAAFNTMPDVRGLGLYAAQQALEDADVLIPSLLGYFSTWPITVNWVKGSIFRGVVIDQSPFPGDQIAPNAPVTLTVIEYAVSVAYP